MPNPDQLFVVVAAVVLLGFLACLVNRALKKKPEPFKVRMSEYVALRGDKVIVVDLGDPVGTRVTGIEEANQGRCLELTLAGTPATKVVVNKKTHKIV
ncbi:MAG: hypothetical protein WDZ90_03230 [Candidatus Paceibacterota bacterium]